MASHPTYEDADLILKLYDLRREAGLRRARQWMTHEFWPASAEDIFAVLRDFGSEENQWFRQATTYWEMACSFVNRRIVDRELFIDSGTEPIFIYAKLRPFVAEVRSSTNPAFIAQLGEYAEGSERTRKIMQYMERGMAQRAEVARSKR
ncbi:MAG: hypothetical protein JOZ43_09080 [Acidobacteriales bacterium]|nr:hypothetical protein [Terriglobales bacterium]